MDTRCDPYTAKLLSGINYHYCCHSNLIRLLSRHCRLEYTKAEHLGHDVLNLFMCTAFSKDTHQYVMKASPVQPGDFIEFFAEKDLFCGLSACPSGDCSSDHSSDSARSYPLFVEIFKPNGNILDNFPFLPKSLYGGTDDRKAN